MWIGFDLGGTKMQCTAYDDDYAVLARQRRKTSREAGAANVDRLIETLREVVDSVEEGELQAIGIGCPGPIDLGRGVLLDAPNLGWKDLPLEKILREEFGCPVKLVNDVDAGLFGESRRGAARAHGSALGVFPGTGIGGGYVLDGKILSGARRTAMEIGHILVQPEGPLCGCGRRGCLEAVASRLAVAGAAAQAVMRGEAPFLAEDTGPDVRKIRSRALRESIQNGDASVESIVRHAARILGRAVGGVVNLLAPDVVILGGGLVEALPLLYVEEVLAGANETVMPSFVDEFEVLVAELGDDAGVLGAAAWARESAV